MRNSVYNLQVCKLGNILKCLNKVKPDIVKAASTFANASALHIAACTITHKNLLIQDTGTQARNNTFFY